MANVTCDLQSPIFTRRRFLDVIIGGGISMALPPWIAERADAQNRKSSAHGENSQESEKPENLSNQTGNVTAYLSTFATDLGFSKSGLIKSYQKNLPAPLKETVQNLNKKWMTSGFNDFSASTVYSAGYLFFYAVRHQDRFNASVAFWNWDYKTVCAIEDGPSLVGLAAAARLLRQERNLTPPECCLLLYPKQRMSSSVGNFRRGYTTPTTFQTQLGIVHIDYRNAEYSEKSGRGEGSISITVIKDTGGRRSVVLDKDLRISYAGTTSRKVEAKKAETDSDTP